jgi:peptide/nickel transport system substrate-binding protein
MGTHVLNVTATYSAPSVAKWTLITLNVVTAPFDFTISISPSALITRAGESCATTVTVASIGLFDQNVTLSTIGYPSDVLVSFAPAAPKPDPGTTASSVMRINVGPNATVGQHGLIVTGTCAACAGYELAHTTELTLVILAKGGDFVITATPASLSLGPSMSGTSTVKVHSLSIFSDPVTLAHSGAPGGLTLAFSANPVTPPVAGMAESVLTVTVAGAPAGSYNITVTGTSGALTRSTTLSVQVTIGGGGCLIATATYGSELSDEVQFLRNFRDHSVMKTQTGSSFMTAFNIWYYSFSPYVAQFIREHPTVKTAVKLLLYPLIGILGIGADVPRLVPAGQEAGVVASGLVVGPLIGATYLTAPLTALLAWSSQARRVAKRLRLPALAVVTGALVAAFSATAAGASVLIMVATWAIVLASITASGLFTSEAILRLTMRTKD